MADIKELTEDLEATKALLDIANMKVDTLSVELTSKYHETASYIALIADKSETIKHLRKTLDEKIEVIGKQRLLLIKKDEEHNGRAAV